MTHDPTTAGAAPFLPSQALPKEGGALRGQGEKVALNPARGACAMTIPVATSPGRGGGSPGLELSYDSSAGNSPFGLGWRVAVPSVTRKTDKGLPRYTDESDTFLLAGAEDLVPGDDPYQVIACDRSQRQFQAWGRTVRAHDVRLPRRVDSLWTKMLPSP